MFQKLLNILICVLIALFTLLISACSDSSVDKDEEPAVRVSLTEVKPASRQMAQTFNGNLRRTEQAILSFETVGTLKNIAVFEGDIVKQGQLIARLDSTVVEQQVQQAENALIDRESELKNIALTHERIQSLLKKDFASQAEFDESALRLNTAKNAVLNAQSAVLSAQQRLDDTIIVAPYDSVISEVLVEPQEQVGVLQPIARILRQDSRSQVEVRIDEGLATRLKIGSKHIASVPALNIDNIDVTLIEITANSSQLNTYRATFVSDSVVEGAIDGLSATIDIAATPQTTSYRWFIPHGSYQLLPEGDAYLFILDKASEKLQKMTINIGNFNEEGVFVAGDLEDGQLIVNRGINYLSDGQAVRSDFNRPALINK